MFVILFYVFGNLFSKLPNIRCLNTHNSNNNMCTNSDFCRLNYYGQGTHKCSTCAVFTLIKHDVKFWSASCLHCFNVALMLSSCCTLSVHCHLPWTVTAIRRRSQQNPLGWQRSRFRLHLTYSRVIEIKAGFPNGLNLFYIWIICLIGFLRNYKYVKCFAYKVAADMVSCDPMLMHWF